VDADDLEPQLHGVRVEVRAGARSRRRRRRGPMLAAAFPWIPWHGMMRSVTERREGAGLSAGQLGMILGARLTLLLGSVGLCFVATLAPSGLREIFVAAALLVFLGYVWVHIRTRRLFKSAAKAAQTRMRRSPDQ
jgi:hypothetical protein